MAKKDKLRPIERKAIGMMVSKDVTGKTNQDIADDLGIDITTLWQWRQKEPFIKELNNQAEKIQQSIVNDAYAGLRSIMADSKAKDSNKIQAIKLILQQQGKMTERKEHTIKSDEPDISAMLDKLKTDKDSKERLKEHDREEHEDVSLD